MKLDLFVGTGYAPGGFHIPSPARISAILASPAITAEVDPPAAAIGSSLISVRVTGSPAQLRRAELARLTWPDGSADIGWVSAASVRRHDPDPGKCVVRLDIEPDPWWTWISAAGIGEGRIRRHAPEPGDPDQPLICRRRDIGEIRAAVDPGIPGMADWWVVLQYAHQDGKDQPVRTRMLTWPAGTAERWIMAYRCPSAADLLGGKIAQTLGIATDAVLGVHLSPIPPLQLAGGSGTQGDPYRIPTHMVPHAVQRALDPPDWPAGRTVEFFTSLEKWDSKIDWTREIDGGRRSTMLYSDRELAAWLTGELGSRAVHREGGIRVQRLLPWDHDYHYGFFDPAARDQLWIGAQKISHYLSSILDHARITSASLAAGSWIEVRGSWIARSVWWSCSDHDFALQGEGRTDCTVALLWSGDRWTAAAGDPSGAPIDIEWWISPGAVTAIVLHSTEASAEAATSTNVDPRGALYDTLDHCATYAVAESPEATDVVDVAMVSPDGDVVGQVPRWTSTAGMTARIVLGSSPCLELRTSPEDGVRGLLWQWPLPSLPLARSAWSDYVVSGQQELAARTRELARQQALETGLAGIGTSAAIGAAAAAAGGIGAAAGAAGGAGTGLAGTLGTWLLAGRHGRQQQELAEEGIRHTVPAARLLGSGADTWHYGGDLVWVSTVPDPESLDRHRERLAEYGSITDVIDCPALSGPLAVEDLQISGIPPAAAAAIAARLAAGVYVDP